MKEYIISTSVIWKHDRKEVTPARNTLFTCTFKWLNNNAADKTKSLKKSVRWIGEHWFILCFYGDFCGTITSWTVSLLKVKQPVVLAKVSKTKQRSQRTKNSDTVLVFPTRNRIYLYSGLQKRCTSTRERKKSFLIVLEWHFQTEFCLKMTIC